MRKRIELLILIIAMLVLSCGCSTGPEQDNGTEHEHTHDTAETLPPGQEEDKESLAPVSEVVDISSATDHTETSLSEEEQILVDGVARQVYDDIVEGLYDDILGDESHVERFRVDSIRFVVVPYTEAENISRAETLVIRDAPLKDGKRSVYKLSFHSMTLICTDEAFVNEFSNYLHYLIEQYPNMSGNAIGLMLRDIALESGWGSANQKAISVPCTTQSEKNSVGF